MIIAFDLDDTLCQRPKEVESLGKDKYDYCEPKQEMIDVSNKLYELGHTILIYTARGMMTYNGDVKLIYLNLYDKTISHLEKWGVKHNGLIMGKLHYDLLIDDKALDLVSAKEKLLTIINTQTGKV